jgi:hypothetical protein
MTVVTAVIQSPLPNWIGYGVYTCPVREAAQELLHRREVRLDPSIGSASPVMCATMSG